MSALALTPLEVLGTGDFDSGLAPVVRETIRVIHVHIDRPGSRDGCVVGLCKVDGQVVTVCERVERVVTGGRETESLVVVNGSRCICDRKNRLDPSDPH